MVWSAKLAQEVIVVTEKFKSYPEAVAFVKGLKAGGITPKQVRPVHDDGSPFIQLNCDEQGRWTHDVSY